MKKKILLIDDSKTQLSTLKIFFTREGFEVETATDGISGYKKIFETAPDIIVSDIMMPNLNGYQFCRLTKDNYLTQSIPFVLLTVLDQKIDKFWSKKSGADVFMLKSGDFEKMLDTVKTLLEKNPISEELKEKIKNHNSNENIIQEELNQILDDALMQASVLNEFRLLASHLENDNQMAKNLFELLSSILDFDAALLMFDSSSTSKKLIYSSGCPTTNSDILNNIVLRNIAPIFNLNSEFDFEIISTDVSETKEINDNIFQNSYIHRIKYFDEIIGVICFYNKQANTFRNQKFFDLLLKEIDLLVTIQTLYNQNKLLSLTDSLTGLFNRRYLLDMLEREYSRARRYGSNFSAALIDLDFFKRINDEHGHLAGDFVLREITDYIRKSLRKSDVVFRYGGEEIFAILPETTRENAVIPFERIRKHIENHEFIYDGKPIKTTISVGITDTLQKSDSIENFIEHADKAMYQAKQLGRNRIEMYNE